MQHYSACPSPLYACPHPEEKTQYAVSGSFKIIFLYLLFIALVGCFIFDNLLGCLWTSFHSALCMLKVFVPQLSFCFKKVETASGSTVVFDDTGVNFVRIL